MTAAAHAAHAVHAVCLLSVSGTLATSGLLKARDTDAAAASFAGLPAVPTRVAPLLARGLPAIEGGLAAGLVVTSGWLFGLVASATLALLLAFTVVVALALRQDDVPACPCFGASTEPVSPLTLARNAALCVAAAATLVLVQPYAGLPHAVATHSPAWAALVLLASASIGLHAWQWSSHRSLRRQRDDLDDRLRAQLADAAVGRSAPPSIPGVSVVDALGDARTLTELVERPGRAQLVVVVSPTCSACHDLMPMLPAWRDQLQQQIGVLLLSWGGVEESRARYGDQGEHLVISADGSAARALGVGGTPSAVLLGLDGTVAAGPAAGLAGIVDLLTAVVQAIGVNTMTGRLHGEQPIRPVGGEDSGADHLPATGSPLADVRVRDEHGRESGLPAALSRIGPDVAVVAWRDSCPYCAEVASELAQFSARGEVVLLVNEDVASVRAQGLSGPVLQTVGADASAALGLPGTPGGYPVIDGRVADGGGVGGGSVLRMLIDRARSSGSYVETPALAHRLHHLPRPHEPH